MKPLKRKRHTRLLKRQINTFQTESLFFCVVFKISAKKLTGLLPPHCLCVWQSINKPTSYPSNLISLCPIYITGTFSVIPTNGSKRWNDTKQSTVTLPSLTPISCGFKQLLPKDTNHSSPLQWCCLVSIVESVLSSDGGTFVVCICVNTLCTHSYKQYFVPKLLTPWQYFKTC